MVLSLDLSPCTRLKFLFLESSPSRRRSVSGLRLRARPAARGPTSSSASMTRTKPGTAGLGDDGQRGDDGGGRHDGHGRVGRPPTGHGGRTLGQAAAGGEQHRRRGIGHGHRAAAAIRAAAAVDDRRRRRDDRRHGRRRGGQRGGRRPARRAPPVRAAGPARRAHAAARAAAKLDRAAPPARADAPAPRAPRRRRRNHRRGGQRHGRGPRWITGTGAAARAGGPNRIQVVAQCQAGDVDAGDHGDLQDPEPRFRREAVERHQGPLLLHADRAERADA